MYYHCNWILVCVTVTSWGKPSNSKHVETIIFDGQRLLQQCHKPEVVTNDDRQLCDNVIDLSCVRTTGNYQCNGKGNLSVSKTYSVLQWKMWMRLDLRFNLVYALSYCWFSFFVIVLLLLLLCVKMTMFLGWNQLCCHQITWTICSGEINLTSQISPLPIFISSFCLYFL